MSGREGSILTFAYGEFDVVLYGRDGRHRLLSAPGQGGLFCKVAQRPWRLQNMTQ